MAEETGEAHRAQTLLALAAEAEPHLIGSDDATWMDRLERDHDGMRAAFSWFLKHGKGAEALQLAADLWLFQEQRGTRTKLATGWRNPSPRRARRRGLSPGPAPCTERASSHFGSWMRMPRGVRSRSAWRSRRNATMSD